MGKKNKNYTNQNNKKEILIKDVFKEEIYQICLYIYCEMNSRRQKDAVKAWDRFEDLCYQPITNKEAVKKVIHLIEIHSKSTGTIKYDEKKYSKYL